MPDTKSQPRSTTSATALDDLAATTVVVLDTSVLAADPEALNAFPEQDIVLPLTVIEELDGLKARPDDVGRNARRVVRALEELRVTNGGSLSTAVDLPDGGTIRIEPNGLRLDALETFHLDPHVADHRILAAALGLKGDYKQVTVVSADGAMRLKADTLGLEAKDYTPPSAPAQPVDSLGYHFVDVSPGCVELVYASRHIDLDDLDDYDREALAHTVVNEFVVLQAGKQSALVRRTRTGLALLKREASTPEVYGLRGRNKEQRFALELLTDPDVPIVALKGRAGTGKTLLAFAAALEQVLEQPKRYDRIIILRPMYAVGRQDIGFLPGDVAEKVAPWFDAIVDALMVLHPSYTVVQARAMLEGMVAEGRLAMEPVTFLRGRTLAKSIVIVDEMQNNEIATAKTILTRIGEGSKVVVVGDPDPAQADNPFVSKTNNGLAHMVNALVGQPEFGHVTLVECERSRVADLAADLL